MTRPIGPQHTASATLPAHALRPPDEAAKRLNRLKHCRGIATRYSKLARNFLAAVWLASVRIWIRHYESTT